METVFTPTTKDLRDWADNPAASRMAPVSPASLRSVADRLDAQAAEMAALKEQLASFARGVKISIPTDTMEHEFHQHYLRGAASRDKEIAALKADYLRACQTIADMHEAATGRAGEAPYLGVVEDVAALKVERDALKRDAGRYQWLRSQNWNDAAVCVVINPKQAVKLGYDCPTLSRLDDAIDAAMQAQEATP